MTTRTRFLLGAAAMYAAASQRVYAAQSQRLRVNLRCTKRPDAITLRQSAAHGVTVRIDYVDGQYPSQTFHFAVNGGSEDAVCAIPVQLRRERTIGAHCEGFAIVDERCDSIHFTWNPKTHRAEWWRL